MGLGAINESGDLCIDDELWGVIYDLYNGFVDVCPELLPTPSPLRELMDEDHHFMGLRSWFDDLVQFEAPSLRCSQSTLHHQGILDGFLQDSMREV